jgi:hypothetical protein
MATVYDGASGPEIEIPATRASDGAAVTERVPGMFLVDANGTPAAFPPTPVTAAAQDSTGAMKPADLTFLGHQLDVAITTSNGLTVPNGTRYAVIQAKGAAAVKYRYDGVTTAPTASVGMTLPANSELAVDITALANMRFIQAAASAVLDVAYFS